MITQILVATLIVSVLTLINLWFAIYDYRRVVTRGERRREDTVRALRRVVVGFCWFSVPASFAFRSALVVLGLENGAAGIVVFWTWLGINVVGGLYAVISEWYD